MKPSKEQLADPKWWDENADSRDKYCYMDKTDGECFTTWHFDDGVHGFELLAKRPEQGQKWKPKEGEWFTASGGAQMAFIGIDSGKAYVCEIKGGGLTRLHDFDGCKPIKTQREELIDIIIMNSEAELDAAAVTASIILGKYDLTKKDDN